MYDVHELAALEDLVASVLDVGTNEAAHPVVGDDHRWEDLELAEALESCECEEYKLLRYVHGSFAVVRL